MGKLLIINLIYYLNIKLIQADVSMYLHYTLLQTYVTLSGKNVTETHCY